jgi:hypothetical protein
MEEVVLIIIVILQKSLVIGSKTFRERGYLLMDTCM